jgi:hypothetical protein
MLPGVQTVCDCVGFNGYEVRKFKAAAAAVVVVMNKDTGVTNYCKCRWVLQAFTGINSGIQVTQQTRRKQPPQMYQVTFTSWVPSATLIRQHISSLLLQSI